MNRLVKVLRVRQVATRLRRLMRFFQNGDPQKYQELLKAAYIEAKRANPKAIIVDEPMVGMDPKGARLLKDAFVHLAHTEGKTIFMSTHTLEVAQEVCDRIGIVNQGKLIAEGTMEELRDFSKNRDADLEEIFLKLTGGEEIRELMKSLQG